MNSVIEEGLEGQEYVSLLQWVEQTYPGPELMASPALGNNILNMRRIVLMASPALGNIFNMHRIVLTASPTLGTVIYLICAVQYSWLPLP